MKKKQGCHADCDTLVLAGRPSVMVGDRRDSALWSELKSRPATAASEPETHTHTHTQAQKLHMIRGVNAAKWPIFNFFISVFYNSIYSISIINSRPRFGSKLLIWNVNKKQPKSALNTSHVCIICVLIYILILHGILAYFILLYIYIYIILVPKIKCDHYIYYLFISAKHYLCL